jgi:hypothetical protein
MLWIFLLSDYFDFHIKLRSEKNYVSDFTVLQYIFFTSTVMIYSFAWAIECVGSVYFIIIRLFTSTCCDFGFPLSKMQLCRSSLLCHNQKYCIPLKNYAENT